MLSYFSNPQRFDQLARIAIPVCGIGGLLLAAIGVYVSFFASPPDYQQGDTVRIMYVHVPAAYMASAIYAGMAVASFIYFVWRHSLADAAADVMAPIGATFTALALATGSLWGKPMWGTWWEWDARMTSVLVMLLIYLGYIALRGAIEDRQLAARMAAILAMIGVINLVIVRFSVEWWSSLHQPASIIRMDGPTIDGSQLTPLFLMMGAYTLLAAWLVFYRLRSRALVQRARSIQSRREREGM
ncbi:heme ABC transporter permease [Maricaulis sp.]|uniref:heme ABC transporter permease n=1 Tax=Maricaulis sp. TaxID=1486257 RepID=UPI00261EFA02|nr:heme ABC transporter permease [Maricaulis sp.]